MNCMQSELCLYSGVILLTAQFKTGSMAEWSNALVLGTSLFGCASSSLAATKHSFLFSGFIKKWITKKRFCTGVVVYSIKVIPDLLYNIYF